MDREKQLMIFLAVWLLTIIFLIIYFLYLFVGVSMLIQILNNIMHVFLERNKEIGDYLPK